MATFLHSPLSPSSVQESTSFASTSRDITSRLSGATTFESLHDPEAYTNTPNTTSDMHCRPVSKARRSSTASTTKSQLRHTNRTLAHMLENVQKELVAHRSLMLDMQSRMAHLEQSSRNHSHKATAPVDRKATTPRHPRHATTRETQTWWEACQNFAHNCDTPFSATEFLKTPRRLSGFDFNFQPQKPHRQDSTTPELNEVPALTPASDGEEHSSFLDTPERRPDNKSDDAREAHLGQRNDDVDAYSDIVEHIVEFDKMRISPTLVLQTPPRSLRSVRSKVEAVGDGEEGITALPKFERPVTPPPVVDTSPQQQQKRIKSFFKYKGLLRRGVGNSRSDGVLDVRC